MAEATEADLGAWRELAANAAQPNPFFEPEFVLPAVSHLDGAAGALLLVIEDGSGWSACLPAHLGRWRGVVKSVWGLRTRYTFATTPLVRAGAVRERIAGLLRAARDVAGRRSVVLERYSADSPVGVAIRQLADAGEVTEALAAGYERALLRRKQDPADYLRALGRKQRNEFKRLRRRLEEAHGEIETIDLSADPNSPGRFLALEAAGWKGREGTAMASRRGDARFFAELCERFRAADRLEMLALRSGGEVIAMLCNLRSGVCSYSFKIAHDEEYAKYSPGIQIEVANFDFFHASGSEWMDSCAEPDNAMINRLWPERRRIRTSVLAPADARGRILKAGLSAASTVRSRLRGSR